MLKLFYDGFHLRLIIKLPFIGSHACKGMYSVVPGKRKESRDPESFNLLVANWLENYSATENFQIVSDLYSLPGLSITSGNSGRFIESG